MDFWDPALINALAKNRPIIQFDYAGVGKSGGEVAVTYAGWADNAIALTRALNISQVDVLGFSMGGYTAQMVALNAPDLVRRLILAGTAASQNPNTVPNERAPSEQLANAGTPQELEVALALSFYNATDERKEAAKASGHGSTSETSRLVSTSLDPRALLDRIRLSSTGVIRTSPNPSIGWLKSRFPSSSLTAITSCSSPRRIRGCSPAKSATPICTFIPARVIDFCISTALFAAHVYSFLEG